MAKFYMTSTEGETKELGKQWASRLKPGSVLGLAGELGSGKTCFVHGLAEGLDIPPAVCVSSPTYVLIHEYPSGRLPLYHFDFYRLQNRQAAVDLNLEEYFEGDGISVVEWADRFPELFPERTQWIYFKVAGANARDIRC